MVLAACVLASSMALIDGSALTVALPRLRADLHADLASVQWILNGYALSLASLTLIGGVLADERQRRQREGVPIENPLNGGEIGVEIGAQPRKRDGQRGAVDQGH